MDLTDEIIKTLKFCDDNYGRGSDEARAMTLRAKAEVLKAAAILCSGRKATCIFKDKED